MLKYHVLHSQLKQQFLCHISDCGNFPSSVLQTASSFSIPTMPVLLHAIPVTPVQQLTIIPTKLSQSLPAMSIPIIFSFSNSIPSATPFST